MERLFFFGSVIKLPYLVDHISLCDIVFKNTAMTPKSTLFITAGLCGLLLQTSAQADVFAGDAAFKQGNYAEAMREYQAAGEVGDAEAQNMVGSIYLNALGVPQNYDEAVRWYRRAVDQNNALAEYNLGAMYDDGLGVTKNYAEAMRLYLLAAKQKYTSAEVRLGLMYASGHGVPKDDVQAVAWYRQAAMQGDSLAQNNLANNYEHGLGVPKNYAAAITWYRTSTSHHNALATDNLGAMYANGYGVENNKVAAYALWSAASEAFRATHLHNARQHILDNLTRLSASMTPEELEIGNKLAQNVALSNNPLAPIDAWLAGVAMNVKRDKRGGK